MADIVTMPGQTRSGGPSEKERRYDRQLRLWAASGQAALESANVLLVNSGAGTVGVEILKNLVLPGIGSFTIVDAAIVQDPDLGVNFFLDDSCLGRSRAECCTKLLLELNPEVTGNWYPKAEEPLNLNQVLATNPTFTVILYTFPIAPEDLFLIESYGQKHVTPVVSVHSAGFYSYFRVHLPGPFPIVDTHPDETATTDLRLLRPWDELSVFAREMTKDINNLDNYEHGHLPFVVILLHYLDVWKASHDGGYPATYADKVAFRKMVSDAARRNNAEGGEENFDEAVAAVLKTVTQPSLPSSVKEVFDYDHAKGGDRLGSDGINSSFWIIAGAIKQFYEKHGYLPVPGSLPDMKAQSTVYIQLQSIYKAKARRDVIEVLEVVRSVPGGESIDIAEVELFCKNAAFIKLINGSKADPAQLKKVIEQEFSNDAVAAEAMQPFSLMPIYLSLLATSHVSSASPGEILAKVSELAPEADNNERLQQAAEEVGRAGGGELHNISATIGGMVAQEMIKIITKQYVPIDNTCIFDGIASRCQVLRL